MLSVVVVTIEDNVCQDFFQSHIHLEEKIRGQVMPLCKVSYDLTQSFDLRKTVLEKHRYLFAHSRLAISISAKVFDSQGGNIITLLGASGKTRHFAHGAADDFC